MYAKCGRVCRDPADPPVLLSRYRFGLVLGLIFFGVLLRVDKTEHQPHYTARDQTVNDNIERYQPYHPIKYLMLQFFLR